MARDAKMLGAALRGEIDFEEEPEPTCISGLLVASGSTVTAPLPLGPAEDDFAVPNVERDRVAYLVRLQDALRGLTTLRSWLAPRLCRSVAAAAVMTSGICALTSASNTGQL